MVTSEDGNMASVSSSFSFQGKFDSLAFISFKSIFLLLLLIVPDLWWGCNGVLLQIIKCRRWKLKQLLIKLPHLKSNKCVFTIKLSFHLQRNPKSLWCQRTSRSQEGPRSPSCVLQQVIPNQRLSGPLMRCLLWVHTGTGFVSSSLFLLNEKS